MAFDRRPSLQLFAVLLLVVADLLNCSISAASAWHLMDSANSGEEILELQSDGPVYYLSPITFSARLIGYEKLHYDYYFSTWIGGREFEQSVKGGTHVQCTFTFNIKAEHAGDFRMHVKVKHTRFIIPETIAEGFVNFTLSTQIPARFVLVQNGTTLLDSFDGNGTTVVSSGMPVNASAVINDPGGYFAKLQLSFRYYWTLNGEVGVYKPSIVYTFPSKPQRTSDVMELSMYGQLPNGTQVVDGTIGRLIIAKDPLTALNTSGELWLRRSQITKLSFTCNASTPIYYCFEPLDVPNNSSVFNCTEFHRREQCAFSVVHYFGDEGDHEIRIAVRNAVNDILHLDPLKRFYKVHVYDDESKGLLGLFIVPISCIIVGTIIVVSGVALYKHTKGDIRVEVANFDFGGGSNSLDLDDPIQAALLEERTFWSHLRDELAESSWLFAWLSRTPKRVQLFGSSSVNATDEGVTAESESATTTALSASTTTAAAAAGAAGSSDQSR